MAVSNTLSGGHIRKISYGQSGKDSQVTYQVGNGVASIMHDDEYWDLYGKRRFLVMKLTKDGKEAYIWKELLDIPIEVEYFDPDRKDESSKR